MMQDNWFIIEKLYLHCRVLDCLTLSAFGLSLINIRRCVLCYGDVPLSIRCATVGYVMKCPLVVAFFNHLLLWSPFYTVILEKCLTTVIQIGKPYFIWWGAFTNKMLHPRLCCDVPYCRWWWNMSCGSRITLFSNPFQLPQCKNVVQLFFQHSFKPYLLG